MIEKTKQKKYEEDLKKFNFFYERFYEHNKSMNKMKDTLTEITETKAEKLQKMLDWKANEASFLRDGCNLVINNRRLLAWTYVIGFYMADDFAQKELFQDWQAKLENYTDQLHEKLEKSEDAIKEDINYRHDTLQFTRTITKYYEGIMEYLTNNGSVMFPKSWAPPKDEVEL